MGRSGDNCFPSLLALLHKISNLHHTHYLLPSTIPSPPCLPPLPIQLLIPEIQDTSCPNERQRRRTPRPILQHPILHATRPRWRLRSPSGLRGPRRRPDSRGQPGLPRELVSKRCRGTVDLPVDGVGHLRRILPYVMRDRSELIHGTLD